MGYANPPHVLENRNINWISIRRYISITRSREREGGGEGGW